MTRPLHDTLRNAVRWCVAGWFDAFGKIRRKGGELVHPVANVYQRRISEVLQWGHENGRPVRLICLKPRQKGSSTFSVAALYRRMQVKRGEGLIAGGAHFQGGNLFKILKTYAENDGLDPKSCKVMDTEARFNNGSTIERITLANSNAGRSGTYQAMIITEVAYLAEEGVANAEEVLNGLLKCVPYEPDTFIIKESTAKGANGMFYDGYQKAITFEEFKEGKNGDVKIFAAWFEFEDSRMPPESEGIRSEDDLTPREVELAAEWGLELDQIAWMRWALREECKGNWDRFQQDYPTDESSAFLKSGRSAFGSNALRYQEQVAKRSTLEYGMLVHNESSDRMTWIPTEENEAMLVRTEPIKVGCRYVVSVDPATGADQTGGEDPDSHAVVVVREGYVGHDGEWHDPAVVMCNMMVPESKGGALCCWWAIDVLEEQVWRMARYWQAIVCPEMNKESGMVELLKMRGDVEICQREIFNRRENEFTKALGWVTDKDTRPKIIEALSARLRNAGKGVVGSGIEARVPWIVDQMRNFIVTKTGRAEAASGKHDDFVMSLAIGQQHLGYASAWRELAREAWIPRDLRDAMERRKGGGSRTFM